MIKIFASGAQRTWDTACGRHVRAYMSKTNLQKLILQPRCAMGMGYGMWPTCPCVYKYHIHNIKI